MFLLISILIAVLYFVVNIVATNYENTTAALLCPSNIVSLLLLSLLLLVSLYHCFYCGRGST